MGPTIADASIVPRQPLARGNVGLQPRARAILEVLNKEVRMSTRLDLIKQWNAVFEQWRDANSAAKEARGRVNKAYEDRALGKGAEPSQADTDEALRLEQLADALAVELEASMKKIF